MMIYLLFILAMAVVLGFGKIIFLVVAEEITSRWYLAVTSIYWLLIAVWTAYWIINV